MTDLFRALVISALEFHIGASRSEQIVTDLCAEMGLGEGELGPDHMEDFAGRVFAMIEDDVGARKANFVSGGLRRFGWISNKEDIPIPIPSEPVQDRPKLRQQIVHHSEPARQRGGRERTTDSSDYSFERFVVSRENSAAHDVTLRVAHDQDTAPLATYILGPQASGKSHLLRAVENEIVTGGNRMLKIQLAAASSIRRELEDLSEDERLITMHDYYGGLDVLLVDDIELLAPSPRIQEGLVTIIQDMISRKRHVVVTGELPPDETDLQQDLAQILADNIVLLDYPSLDARVRVLEQSVRERGWLVDELTLKTIARYCPTNLRRLKAGLFDVVGKAFDLGKAPSPELVDQVMGDPR